MSVSDTKLWMSMTFRDPDAMMRFLIAIGFEEHVTYRAEADPSHVEHAEWLWPAGGGIMFGTATSSSTFANVGRSGMYLVCDDPDDLVARAITAGGTVREPVIDQGYGGRGGSVLDPEGNFWSFGSYQPA